jgi:hypothetical protein
VSQVCLESIPLSQYLVQRVPDVDFCDVDDVSAGMTVQVQMRWVIGPMVAGFAIAIVDVPYNTEVFEDFKASVDRRAVHHR